LDPSNTAAAQGLERSKRMLESVVRVAYQEPGRPVTPPEPARGAAAAPPPPADTATLEHARAAETLARDALTNDIEQRLQAARELLNASQPDEALRTLRVAQNAVRSASDVPEIDRTRLDRRIQAQLISTAQTAERIDAELLEQRHVEAARE